MELEDVIHVLKTVKRQGAGEDRPEGARFIAISETLANAMIAALEQYEQQHLGQDEMSGAVKGWLDEFETMLESSCSRSRICRP